MIKTFYCCSILVFFIPIYIFSSEIFINGTKVTGIKDHEINNCNVKIDSDGNIHIDAPGIKIVTTKEKLNNEYFIAVSLDAPLSSEFKISLNGKVIGKLDPGMKETLIELGTGVIKGENIISFITEPAEKPVGFTILAGTGVKKGDNLEFVPLYTQKGSVNHIGAAGNFKIIAE